MSLGGPHPFGCDCRTCERVRDNARRGAEALAAVLEEPKPATPMIAQLLEGWANNIVARYGHPVYLVGSALNCVDIDWQRDVDVVCILPDDEFNNRFDTWEQCVRFGDKTTPGARRWAAEVGKLSAQASKMIPRLNIDFKVQSESWVLMREGDKPRLRIDTASLEET